MINECKKLQNLTLERIEKASTRFDVNEIRVAVLGKNGELTAILRGMRDLGEAEKIELGKVVNEARGQIEQKIRSKNLELETAEINEKLNTEKIDITIDKPFRELGGLHPINQTMRRICDFFASMGYMVFNSFEVETDYYNFEALNTPADHPARDMQDTFFIAENILLRSQTSTGQIRLMEKQKPPLKMISPGKVYRADEVDATHSPMFHQIEGLVVDRGVTLVDLKNTLEKFAAFIFGKNTMTRFRPSFFPFTEPSVEVDASCYLCGGKDTSCRVCKGTGWLEILGAGMVNIKVLENCKIDPKEFSGFAFGMGVDRITNILHNITDLRIAFENDIRFIRQFRGGII